MNINNYYFNNIGAKLVDKNYWDFSLSSDNQGICLDYVFACGDVNSGTTVIQDKLVLWFDVNNSGTTIDGSSLTSLTEWDSGKELSSTFGTFGGSNNIFIKPTSGLTLCDFGLTGTDNGRYNTLSGITVNITTGDTKLILYPVTGYTLTNTISGATKGRYDYPWLYQTGSTSGCDIDNNICLDGGFYQGYFKLDFLDPAPITTTEIDSCGDVVTTNEPGDKDKDFYQIMPTEFEDGWTMETWVKWGGSCCVSATTSGLTATTVTCLSGDTLNDNYPNNEGFFFYIGTRAENKFNNSFSGETGLVTCEGVAIGKDVEAVVYDNGTANWFLKDKKLIGLTDCAFCCCTTTGSTNGVSATTVGSVYCDELSENALGFRVTPDGRIGYRKMTVTGACFNNQFKITGTTMEEAYSDPILTVSGSGMSQILVTYTQGSNMKNTLPAGVLRIWLNGRVILKVDDFIGLQLRALNEKSGKQLGVPFNISWGGGTQGLAESNTFGGPDLSDRNGLLETYFAGTFNGELSQLRFYEKPLNVLEIRNNFFAEGCPRYCKFDTFGGSQTKQPSSEFCKGCDK